MSEASDYAAQLPETESGRHMAVPESRRLPGQQVRATDRWSKGLERVGRFVGAFGGTLAIVGFALPLGDGWYQIGGYETLLLLCLRGNWALTNPGSEGLGWGLVPLVFFLGVSVLAGPVTLSLMAESVTERFPRLSLGVFVVGCMILWYVVGAPFCLAAAVAGPVAFVARALLTFRNPARSHPLMYALVPLAGSLAYGGGTALYVANGVYWSLGTAAAAGSLASTNSVGIGFWLGAAGWLLATLGGTLLWQAQRQAESR